jgi:DNA-binding beta-propeller fold protein YncE
MKTWLHLFPILITSVSAIAAGSSYTLDPKWPKPPIQDWGEIPGVSIDSDDNVWVFHRGVDSLQLFSNDGERLPRPKGMEFGKFGKPHQVRILGGDLWLVDQGKHVVERISEGRALVLGKKEEPGNDEVHFNQPTDVAIGRNGDIYVTDGYVNSRVVQFNSRGEYRRAWGRKGSLPGEFKVPHAIVADSKGRLYVADRSNQRIQIFDEDGNYLSEWKSIVPWGLWITKDDKIFVCGSSPFDAKKLTFAEKGYALAGMLGVPPRDQVVMRINTDGMVEETWKFNQTNWVHGIAIDSKGNLFLSDIQGHRVRKFIPR